MIALSLAVGIGANTAIFGLYRALLLKPLPVSDPDALVLLYWGGEQAPRGMMQSSDSPPRATGWASSGRSFSYPFFRELTERTDVFTDLFAFAPVGMGRQNTTLTADGGGERVDAEMVSGSFFKGLRVVPELGRAISPEDERSTARVAVISHAYWSRRFAGTRDIVGKTISLNENAFEVIGVAPHGFFGVQPGRMPDVWIPLMELPGLTPWGSRPERLTSFVTAHDYWWVRVMGRMREGNDRSGAERALDGALQNYVSTVLPAADRQRLPHLGLQPGAAGIDVLRSTYERPLRILMSIAAAVLLIACANVAVLLLSHGMARRRELAMRLALGATRARLVRQLMTESLALAVVGATLGMLCAAWTARALLLLVPAVQRPVLDTPMDAGVLMFAITVAVATSVLFGVAPALVASRVDVLPSIRAALPSMASESAGHRFWSSTFVIVQVALSLVLVVGAVLFLRTLANLRGTPLGVDQERVLVFALDASQNGYAGERLLDVYSRVLRAIQGIAGVETATAARLRLFAGPISLGPVAAAGAQPTALGTGTQWNAVGPQFAATLGIDQLAGPDLEWKDFDGRRRVALVNESLARHLFGDVGVIGRRFNLGLTVDPATEYEIVGVVANAKYGRVRGEFPRVAYVPFTTMGATLRGLSFQIRAAGAPLALGPAVREAVHRVDPRLAIADMDTMPNQVDESLWQERLFARLTTAFSATALLLACMGIYGTIAYGVGRRRNEIAVRIALGARRAPLQFLLLRRALVLAAVGILAGVPIALWGGQFISSMLFGLAASDAATLVVSAVVLVVVAAAAGYVPARRATLLDPAIALKEE